MEKDKMKKELWLRVPTEMFNQVNAIAESQGIRYSALLRQIIQEYLDKKKDICA